MPPKPRCSIKLESTKEKEKRRGSTCMNVFLNIELLPCSNVERYGEAFSDPCQHQY
jgi:hypothetical protein